MAARVRAVVWSESAQNALDEVIEYIAKDSRPAAVQVVDAALEAGVDLISSGALTHSAKALDISLEVENA